MSQEFVDNVYDSAFVVQTTMANVEKNFAALKSSFSGATAPSNPIAGMWWFDTTANILKLRNEANNAWQSVWDFANNKPVIANLSNEITNAMCAAALKDPVAATAGLRTLGTGAQQALPGSSGFPKGVQVFTSSGTWTFAGVGKVFVKVWGASGGGGGSYGGVGAGGGGGGGGYAEGLIAVTGNISVVVGAGGAGGSAGNSGAGVPGGPGGSGGISQFPGSTVIQVTGGAGGGGGRSGTASGGAGGSGSTGEITLSGGSGSSGSGTSGGTGGSGGTGVSQASTGGIGGSGGSTGYVGGAGKVIVYY